MDFDFFTPELQARSLDVLGIENAILDFLVRVENDRQLAELGLEKGTMKLVETEEQAAILEHVGGMEPEIEAGGSCANVLRMASRLGCRTCYSSAVGEDLNGALFAEELTRAGVENRVAQIDGITGTSIVLVSPDGERTMNTHLGVCRDYRREFVPLADIRRSRIFFTTGYIWDTPHQIEAIEAALGAAREAGCRIAVDLADPFAVERSRRLLLELIDSGLDVLFANTEEARMLTSLEAEAASRELSKKVWVAVVTDGADGAYIAEDGASIHVAARRVEVVDTTGAGDCFAAGFLAGLVRGQSLETCGELATLLASDVIGHLGVKLSADIEQRAASLLASD